MKDNAEAIFINRIDCRFPYNDKSTCISLINEAAALSTNAMFFIVEELCRIPSSEKNNVTTERLLDLLGQVEEKFEHPLKEIILETAHKMLNGQTLTTEEVISKMEILKKYNGQYAALNILYFSSLDNWETLDTLMESITSAWTKNAT